MMTTPSKRLSVYVFQKLLVLLAGLLLSASLLPAATYYVDAAAGSGGSGSSGDPYATIQQAADVAGPGDIVNIRPGTYRESVRPANSGSSGSPIVFQRDPATSGAVIVSGADLLIGWTLDATHASGQVYKTSMPWDLNPDNDDPAFGTASGNQLFVGGKMVLEARWPNSGADLSLPTLCHSEAGGTVDSNNGWFESSKIGSELPQGSVLADAVIHMAPGESWNSYTARVTTISGDRLNFNGNLFDPWSSAYHPSIDSPFYIYGKKELLDTPGEWWFDEASQEVFLWAPTGVDPSSLVVESKRRVLAFDLSSRNHITIENIDLFAATITTTRQPWNGYNFASHSTGVTLDGINGLYLSHARYLSGTSNFGDGNQYGNGDTKNTYYWTNLVHNTGIILVGTDHVIRNSTLGFSAGNLLLISGRSCLAENNVLHDANYLGTDTANINLGHFGSQSEDHIIRNNTAYRSGRAICLVRTVKNVQILNNHFYVSNLQSTDVGAIYMYGNDSQGTEIAYNLITDVAGPKHGGAGIYMDERSEDVRIHHNLVYNSQGALRLNEPRDMRVYNNTLVAGDTSLSGMRTNGTTGDITWDNGGYNNYIRNNLFTNVYEFRKSTFSNNLPNTQNTEWDSYGGGAVPFPLPYDDPAPNFQFVDPASGNFQLQAGSPAINAGISTSDGGVAMPAYINGGNNGAPDIGAFEFGRTPWTAGASMSLEPNAPSDLQLVSAVGNAIQLSWSDNASDETAFYVERSSDFRTFEVVATLPANTTSYTDLTQPNLYYYRVRADRSPFSPVLKVNPGRSALARFEAEAYDETGGGAGGVILQGTGITDFGGGEYMLFRNVVFTSDINEFIINLSAGYDSAMEFRLDAVDAPIVATWTPPDHQWSQPASTMTGSVSGFPNGTHDLYITVEGGGHPGNIDWFQFSNGATLPDAPLNLTEDSGQLSWTDNSSNELGFKIERSSDNLIWFEIATVGAGVSSYNATAGFFYRVRAYNALGNSAYSNLAGGTLNGEPEVDVPNTPASLTASSAGATSIQLDWLDLSEIEDGYIVERSLSASSGFAPVSPALSANSVSYTDGGLTTGLTYYYRVKATNGSFESLYSNVASAAPVEPVVIPAPLAYEDFENGLNGGSGWAADWDLGGRFLEANAALSFGSFFPDNTAGAQSIWAGASRSLATPADYNESEVWLAFLVNQKVNSPGDGGGSTFIINDGLAGAIDLQMVVDTDDNVVMHYVMNGGNAVWNQPGSFATTYLFVVKLSDSGSDTTAHIWRYSGGSAPLTEPSEALAAVVTGPAGGQLQNIKLDSWGVTIGYDEIRIGSTYETVLGMESGAPATGFAAWASTAIADAAKRDAADDADNDGLQNLMEYALGLDPDATDGASSLPGLSESSGLLSLSFTRDLSRTDFDLHVQRSDSPEGPWETIAEATSNGSFQPANGLPAGNISGGSGSTVTVTNDAAVTPGSPVFLRLCVDVP